MWQIYLSLTGAIQCQKICKNGSKTLKKGSILKKKNTKLRYQNRIFIVLVVINGRKRCCHRRKPAKKNLDNVHDGKPSSTKALFAIEKSGYTLPDHKSQTHLSQYTPKVS